MIHACEGLGLLARRTAARCGCRRCRHRRHNNWTHWQSLCKAWQFCSLLQKTERGREMDTARQTDRKAGGKTEREWRFTLSTCCSHNWRRAVSKCGCASVYGLRVHTKVSNPVSETVKKRDKPITAQIAPAFPFCSVLLMVFSVALKNSNSDYAGGWMINTQTVKLRHICFISVWDHSDNFSSFQFLFFFSFCIQTADRRGKEKTKTTKQQSFLKNLTILLAKQS